MKVLLDTNIILDFVLERHPFYSDSVQVLSFIYQKQIEGYISASTFSDLYYIIDSMDKSHAEICNSDSRLARMLRFDGIVNHRKYRISMLSKAILE